MRLFIFLLCIVLFSCSQPSEHHPKGETAQTGKDKGPMELNGCYESIFGKDSTLLTLQRSSADSVHGHLFIHYFEKDKNEGNFSGVIDSNKITGWYTFNSEGIQSVRQIVFRISDDLLVEGYGNIQVHGDTSLFKNTDSLKFLDQRPLKKIACK